MPIRAGRETRAVSLAALFAITIAAGCSPQAGAQGELPPPQVGVVQIVAAPYEQTIQLSGRVSAFEVSEVRPQIGGIVRSRRFIEGARVSAGEVLYEIDPGPARADLSSAEAAAASARARYDRYQQLVAIGAISQQDLEDARATADQTAAALQNARISVNYTRVTAPISGVIGASSVTPGALATPAQAEPFAVIQQIDRVYVDMTLSADELLRARQSMGQSGSRTQERARVRLILPDGGTYARDGELQFSDVTVNESTGTVQLRALFPNPDHLLLPGMFVRTELSLGVDPDAILAPQQSVSRNARGEAVVLVLNEQNVVEQRTIETSGTAGDKWVVRSGLSPGDRVIVEGVQRVQPGAAATPAQTATNAAPAAAAAGPSRGHAPQASDGSSLRGREG